MDFTQPLNFFLTLQFNFHAVMFSAVAFAIVFANYTYSSCISAFIG